MRTAIIAAAMLASAGVAQAQDRPSVSLPRGEVRALMAFFWPPIHMPFFLDAAILSRMRSPVTSRSMPQCRRG